MTYSIIISMSKLTMGSILRKRRKMTRTMKRTTSMTMRMTTRKRTWMKRRTTWIRTLSRFKT